jgi:flagellar biosynthesis protein FliQ
MTDMHMLNAMREMIYYVLISVCLITLPTLVVGIVFSILQAATQINEMTITFIPKFFVMFMLIFLLGPSLMNKLVMILQGFMTHLPNYIR